MTPVDTALDLLAFTLFIHILGASLVLGLSWFAFGFELIGRKRNAGVYLASSKTISKAILLIYATIGSLGTGVTVELFAFWPGFMKAVGVLLWWPFAFVTAMILANFLMNTIYWYGFDRIRPRLHLALGFIMALTASLIPFNFRTISAFTNQPVGLTGNAVETTLMYTNPSFPPLYTHTILASLSTAGFVVCAAAALGLYLRRGDANVNMSILRQGVVAGVTFLVPQALAGAWYLWTLGGNVPQMFAAITGLLTTHSESADVQLLPSYIFATKLVIVGCIFLGGIWLMNRGQRHPLSKLEVAISTTLGVLASAVILIGETMQEYSHLPYFVIDRFKVTEFLNSGFPFSVIGVSILGFGIFLGILLLILYVAYIKK